MSEKVPPPHTYVNHTRKRGRAGKDYVRICAGAQRDEYVHRLVAMALLRRELKDGEVPDHIDGDGLNNHPSNIRVRTHSGNSRKSEPPEMGEIILDGREVFNGE